VVSERAEIIHLHLILVSDRDYYRVRQFWVACFKQTGKKLMKVLPKVIAVNHLGFPVTSRACQDL